MTDTFQWSSKEGYDLVRKIIHASPVPYVPHDYQLEGVCKSLDGQNLFAITPTGSGKTSYFILYILVVLAVVKDPSLCPSTTFPSIPCLVIICPTVPLQLEMVR
jgi:superfamily II DNA/RNA helicase